MKIFSAQLKGTTTLAEDAVVTLSSGSFTGSFSGSIAGIDLEANNTFTSSTSARLNAIETVSASNISRLNSIEAVTASNLNRLISLEEKTGSLATTGSNTFIGTQVFTGSVYITSDLIVQGSSSLQNITASAVSIGTNKVILNTDNPAVRYAGISVIDSGSTGLTGSILWDSTNNNWLYQNPSGSSYTSAKFISGPQSQTLGNELGLVTNFIQKAVGDDHISSSAIYDDGNIVQIQNTTLAITGSRVGINTSFPTTALDISGSITTNDTFRIVKTPSDTVQQGPSVYLVGGSGASYTQLQQGVDRFIIFGFNGSSWVERLTINNTNGRVGIGTASPSHSLSISTPTDAGSGLQIDKGGSVTTFLGDGGSVYPVGLLKMYDSGSQTIQLYAGGVSYITGGNVGIGITNPDANLVIGNLNTYGKGSINGATGTINRAIINSPYPGASALTLGYYSSAYGLDIWVNGDGTGLAPVYIDQRNAEAIIFRRNTQASASESMRITGGGNVVIGSTSGTTLNSLTNQLSVSSTTYNLFDISRFSNNAFGPNFYLVKSRNGSIGGNTIVENGDNLGNITWVAANGTGFTDAAAIKAEVDGVPGASNDMPGRLVFSTTADGAGSITERMRITSGGLIGIGTTAPPEPLSVSFAAHGLISQHRPSNGIGVGQNFYMKFNNAAGSAVSYAGIYSDIQDNTTGAHSGRMILQVANAGSLLSAVTIGTNGSVGIGDGVSSIARLNIGGSTKMNRSFYNWYQGYWTGNSTYWHMKTSMWAGGSPNGNTQYTMSLFKGFYYSYSASILEGAVGFHNWVGTIYALKTTGNLFSNVYTSSDGYVVLVIPSGDGETGVTIDWHQAYGYPFVNAQVTAAGLHGSTTGKY